MAYNGRDDDVIAIGSACRATSCPHMTPLADTALEFARWQFALLTLFHFIFVPLTLGLAPLLAVMQTLWHRTGDEKWLRLTRFFGTLFLINFAIGVATGLFQEFQFGMNWSVFSAYVGDVFGTPLAIEGIGAFMLEATFIGLGSSAGIGCPQGAPRHDLPRLARQLALGVLHPHRELLDAAPGRLRDQLADRPHGGERHRRHPLPGLLPVRLGPHPPGRAPHRRVLRARRVVLAPAARHGTSTSSAARRSSRSSSSCRCPSSSSGSGASSASPSPTRSR